MSSSSYQARTKFEAELDVKYCIRLNTLLQRFYQRLASLFLFSELAGGSVAFSAFVAKHPDLAGQVGLFIAAVALGNIVLKPTEKAFQADELRRQYQRLAAKAPKLALDQLDEQLAELRQSLAPDIEGVRNVAYNDNLVESGLEAHCIPETPYNKLCRLLF